MELKFDLAHFAKNRIFPNPYFKLDESQVDAAAISTYVNNWYLITRTYGLGIISLTGLIARSANQEFNITRQKRLEKLLQNLAPQSIDELGMMRGGEMIHHRMFEEQCRRIGAPIDNSFDSFYPEILKLREDFLTAFNDITNGLVMMTIVENILTDIFLMQRKIFLAGGAKNSELIYTNLHIDVELDHIRESDQFVTQYLLDFPNEAERIIVAAERYCETWDQCLTRLWQISCGNTATVHVSQKNVM